MRIALVLALPLLTVAACSVDNDAANDQMTLEYNQQRIEDAARTAREVGSGLGNVAATTGRAISNEVGDIDVDVDVTRNKSVEAGNEAEAK
jgi:hypothetical protein